MNLFFQCMAIGFGGLLVIVLLILKKERETHLEIFTKYLNNLQCKGYAEHLKKENKKLRSMIDNGLGWEDLEDDIEYPSGG